MTESIVVKVGTSSVTTRSGDIDRAVLRSVATDVAEARRQGYDVVLVTSGAITAGWAAVGEGRPRPQDSRTLQAVSAVGQPLLMDAWREAFSKVGLTVGQVLLAPHDFADRSQYLHARGTLESLRELGVVSIVNENDAIADEEIRFGDNDRLAALVAGLIGATRLILLTDTAGLLTGDPRLDPTATLVEEVTTFDDELLALASGSSSGVGSGGMASKLSAARMGQWLGVTTVIAPAREERVLSRVLGREVGLGTLVHPRPDRLSARKAWIAFALPSAAAITVNEGAARAIQGDGRSLLSVGAVETSGDFAAGEAVDVLNVEGVRIAKGVVRASWLGRDDVDVLIHRDELVILEETA